MKYKKELIITLTISILVLFLRFINVFQIENGLGTNMGMLLLIFIFSISTIYIQKVIDRNQEQNHISYENLDILKYICSILILILHLRPFLHFSNELDLTFNNIITRICVPIFFVITGYFVAKKETKNSNYIKDYIKKLIPFYLTWSILYLPVIFGTALFHFSTIRYYLSMIHLPIYIIIILLILLSPIISLIALIYTGVYYHLWYFPAIIFSLLTLALWKKKFPIKYLLLISFILLLFGATETYYGVLPYTIQQLVSYYYKIFFTTRNFLFFGLFYVVLGYSMGRKEKLHTKYCFLKLIIFLLCLIFEAILLHDSNRLNSNILLSCIPLTYYLFISVIYLNHKQGNKMKFPFRDFSKYYYLLHPAIIFVVTYLFHLTIANTNPFLLIFIVLFLTHTISFLIIKWKQKEKLM